MEGMIIGVSIDVLVGIVCFIIGILNMKGNIKMLHSYHINNITEEDRIPFGRLVGFGMIVIGVSIITAGVLLIPNELTKQNIYLIISDVVLFGGLIIGLIICLYAIKKYNKKIFG